jgi:Outer membrane protein
LIIKEVENNYIDLETSIQNIFSTSRAIIKNNKMLQISRMRFKAGVTNQREIVNLQRDLKQSQINYLDAIKNYNVSIAKLQRSTGLKKLEKCNTKKLESTLNSFDEYSLYKLPIIPINKACEISISIKSLNEMKFNSDNDNNEKTKKLEDKNNSTILDSDVPNKRTLKSPEIQDNKDIMKNKNLLNTKDPKDENENEKSKNLKKINFKFENPDKNAASNIENIQPCLMPMKDSDICLDNFVE